MDNDREAKIRECAYGIWERENRPEGKYVDHWLAAEAEVGIEQLPSTDQPEAPSGQADPSASKAPEAKPERSIGVKGEAS